VVHEPTRKTRVSDLSNRDPLLRVTTTAKERGMKQPILQSLVTSLVVTLGLAACGGSAKPAEDAASKKDGAPAAESKETPVASTDSTEKKAEKKEEKADSGMPIVVRKPKDYLTAPDIVFKFSFKESDVGVKADKACYEKTKGEGKKMADCMTAAQKKQQVDDYHFKQDESGSWYLLAMRTKGSAISWTHRMPIDFGKETDKTIVVKITGKDKGQAPWKNPPSEITFEVPNEYQIIQNDPELGRLVFEAKISTLGDGKKPAR
jgi:hypothetical protein